MKRTFAVLAVLASCSAVEAQADEGRPSRQTLSRLGLASMNIASDQAGQQVRGKQFIFVAWTLRQEAGAMMNNDADFVSLGQPLTFDPTVPPFVDIVQNPPPVMDVIVDPVAGEIRTITSDTGFRVVAGSAVDAAPVLPPTFTFSSPSFGSFGGFQGFGQ